MYPFRITRQFKSGQMTEDVNLVERVKYCWLICTYKREANLATLCTTSLYQWYDFSSWQYVLNLLLSGSGRWWDGLREGLFHDGVKTISVVHQRFTVRSRLLCALVMDILLTVWLLIILKSHFRVSVVFFIRLSKWARMSFHFFFSMVSMLTHQPMFYRYPTGPFVIPWTRTARWWIGIIFKRQYCTYRLLWPETVTILPQLNLYIPFMPTKVAIGAMPEIEVGKLFDTQSAASSMFKWAAT